MDQVHSSTGTDDVIAELLDDHATPQALEGATSAEILFAIRVMLLMNEEPKPDHLRYRRPSLQLWGNHSRNRQLGALFQAALRDETAAAQAIMMMNAELVTWSVLLDHVRSQNLTPNGSEATVEDVIHWLASHPNGIGALHEAVRLGLQDQSRSHTPEWLDEAWQHIVQPDLVREAIERASARNATMLAQRYAELTDDEDILGLFRQGAHIGRRAQVVFFERLKNTGMLVELAKQSTTILEGDDLCKALKTEELEEIEKLALQGTYFQGCVRRELRHRALL